MKLLIELNGRSVVQSISDIDNSSHRMNTIEDKLQQYIPSSCEWHRDDNRVRLYKDGEVVDINKDDCIIIRGAKLSTN